MAFFNSELKFKDRLATVTVSNSCLKSPVLLKCPKLLLRDSIVIHNSPNSSQAVSSALREGLKYVSREEASVEGISISCFWAKVRIRLL